MSKRFATIIAADFTTTMDEDGQVNHADHFTPEGAIAYVTANLDKVPIKVRPIVEWALAQACRPVLLKKGGIGEGWFLSVPVTRPADKEELAQFGTVAKNGYFTFDYHAKMEALEWLKYHCGKGASGFQKKNAHFYGADFGPLGWVIVEKFSRNYGSKPWLVRYRLPTAGPAIAAFGGEK